MTTIEWTKAPYEIGIKNTVKTSKKFQKLKMTHAWMIRLLQAYQVKDGRLGASQTKFGQTNHPNLEK